MCTYIYLFIFAVGISMVMLFGAVDRLPSKITFKEVGNGRTFTKADNQTMLQSLDGPPIDISKESFVYTEKGKVSKFEYNRTKVETLANYMNKTGWQEYCKKYLLNNLQIAKYADKVGVKEIVGKYKLNITIPKTYATVSDDRDMNIEMLRALPKDYIFKASHGSAMTVIVHDNSFICHGFCVKSKYVGTSKKGQLEFLKRNCHKWLSIDFGKVHNERHYSAIHRQCFFEEMMPQNNDYKIHTFHGNPAIIEVFTNRFKNHCQTFYTPAWHKINMTKTIAEPATVVEKPILLGEMLLVAKQLSRGVPFVRVDLYISEQNIIFSELTWTPSACRTTYSPAIADTFYGSLAIGDNQDPENIISLLQ
jgi:hypothetical protein